MHNPSQKRNMANKSNAVKKSETKKVERKTTKNKKGTITQSTSANKTPIIDLQDKKAEMEYKKSLEMEAIINGDAPQEEVTAPPPPPAGNKEPKKVSPRRPIYFHNVLPEWGKSLKVGTDLVFTLNDSRLLIRCCHV